MYVINGDIIFQQNFVNFGHRIRLFRKTADVFKNRQLKEKGNLHFSITFKTCPRNCHTSSQKITKWYAESSCLELLRKLALGFFLWELGVVHFLHSPFLWQECFKKFMNFEFEILNLSKKAYISDPKLIEIGISALFGWADNWCPPDDVVTWISQRSCKLPRVSQRATLNRQL